MRVYYNEIDPFAAAWLRELIKHGHLPEGEVDERSISEVEPGDLTEFTQCHFFAGIGGWPYAFRLAGWTDRPVWSGSCPCQPFSVAGKRRGTRDERHLWPEFYRLIAECRPSTIFGEQVASKLGREWLAGIRVDMEQLGYAVGAADLPAACVGAPHIRQRLFWVADARRQRDERWRGVEDFSSPSSDFERETRQREWGWDAATNSGATGGLGDADATRLQGRGERFDEYTDQRSAWTAGEFIRCLDGKARRIEPAFQPLAYGFSGPRMGILRGSGNAIVPQAATAFIRAVT